MFESTWHYLPELPQSPSEKMAEIVEQEVVYISTASQGHYFGTHKMGSIVGICTPHLCTDGTWSAMYFQNTCVFTNKSDLIRLIESKGWKWKDETGEATYAEIAAPIIEAGAPASNASPPKFARTLTDELRALAKQIIPSVYENQFCLLADELQGVIERLKAERNDALRQLQDLRCALKRSKLE